mgnify:CR=1 FL=1
MHPEAQVARSFSDLENGLYAGVEHAEDFHDARVIVDGMDDVAVLASRPAHIA